MREFNIKLENGEYIREFKGYKPYYCGCFYGSKASLGGEAKFSHCYEI